jgi:hypothetical protein
VNKSLLKNSFDKSKQIFFNVSPCNELSNHADCIDQELKLPKFCLWHVAWSLNICPAKFHSTGKSCQKLILSSMASGIFRKQAKLHAAGKICQKTNPINFFACCMSIF